MLGPFQIAKTPGTGDDQRPCLGRLRFGDIPGWKAEREKTIETMGRRSPATVPIFDLYQLHPQGFKNGMGR
jgi:hypothetical protein